MSCTFGPGPLGLGLQQLPRRRKAPGPYFAVSIEKFNSVDGSIGPAEESGVVRPGAVLISVAGRPVAGISYNDVLQQMIDAPRPVDLAFRQPSEADDAAGDLTLEPVSTTERNGSPWTENAAAVKELSAGARADVAQVRTRAPSLSAPFVGPA